MSRLKHITLFISFVLLLVSCKSTQYIAPIQTSSNAASSVEQAYIDRYKDLAISEMIRSGIPASITLAQGMVESDFGRSTLAREANNHFGIKCHSDWKGPTVKHDDDKRNECFRKYSHPEESFRDHSDFLMKGSRYSFLFKLDCTDYKGWAKGLKEAGYATNPQYANMLIKKIDDLSLHQYDLESKNRDSSSRQEVEPVKRQSSPDRTSLNTGRTIDRQPQPSTPVENVVDNELPAIQARKPRLQERNRIQYFVVKEGETLEMMEQEFDLLKWELQKYNEFDDDYVPSKGDIIYIQPKRQKADVGNETHVVKEGESIYSISQLYGVKRANILEYNMMQEDDSLENGQTLWLRGLKPQSR